jgi:hypothetical protein
MRRLALFRIVFMAVIGCSVHVLAGAPSPAPSSPSEIVAIERFLSEVEKPPVNYQARRRLEASSEKLKESAWMEALTEFDAESGFRYSIVAQGGSERIQKRVLKPVLEAERFNTARDQWRQVNLSRANYEFNFSGPAGEGMLKMQLNPRRRDSRLIDGAALLTAESGNLVRVEGRLSKSPSFWVRWVDVSRSYAPIGGAMMPVSIESTADVRIAGRSTFAMTYEYQMVDDAPVSHAPQALLIR